MDVQKYPDFLPWCQKISILSKDDNYLVAEMLVQFSGISKRYISDITIEDIGNTSFVHIKARKGIFKFLYYKWILEDTKESNQTQVSYEASFEFSSKFLNKIVVFMKDVVCTQMVNAFIQRANKLSKK